MPGAVGGARRVVQDADIPQPGAARLVPLEVRPVAGGIGDAHIGIEDRAKPAGRTELRGGRFTRLGIGDQLAAPPPLRLEKRREIAGEVAEGSALLECGDQSLVNVAEHVVARRLRHGEHRGVIVLPAIEP